MKRRRITNPIALDAFQKLQPVQEEINNLYMRISDLALDHDRDGIQDYIHQIRILETEKDYLNRLIVENRESEGSE